MTRGDQQTSRVHFPVTVTVFTIQISSEVDNKVPLALQIFIIVYQFAKHRVTLYQFFRRFNWKEVSTVGLCSIKSRWQVKMASLPHLFCCLINESAPVHIWRKIPLSSQPPAPVWSESGAGVRAPDPRHWRRSRSPVPAPKPESRQWNKKPEIKQFLTISQQQLVTKIKKENRPGTFTFTYHALILS